MNFKKTWKRFFSLSRRSDGFTLVELIVVIAILAILGGVGVPAYSGYIDKTNMAADQTLVRDVKQALELYYYSHPDTTDGYVVLTQGEASGDDTGDAAMFAVFGDNWKESVALSYDSWDDAAAMTNWASTNPYAGSVSGSTYFSTVGTEALLGDVQNCASKLAQVLDSFGWSGSQSASTLYSKITGDNNPDMTNTILGGMDSNNITANVLANATVFGIAGELNKTDKAAATVNGFGEDGYLGDALTRAYEGTTIAPSTVNITDFANTYAALEAFVNYAGQDNTTIQTEWDNFNNSVMSSSDPSTIINGLDTACKNILTEAAQKGTYDSYYQSGQAQKDGEAYVGMMQAVNGLSSDYADSLNQDELFTNSNIADRVNSYVAVSGLSGLPAVSGSAIIAVLSVEDGVPVVQTSIDHLIEE